MNQYETVFILTPVLSDDQTKETVAKFKSLLTENGAEILNEESWGLKKLAYNIQKKSSGFYFLIEFKAERSQRPCMTAASLSASRAVRKARTRSSWIRRSSEFPIWSARL